MGYAAVTTPLVVATLPASGLVAPVPWISAIVAVTFSGGGGGTLPAFSGVRAPTVKSVALLSVSVPVALRAADVVLLGLALILAVS